MKKSPDNEFIKSMLKHVETPAVRVLYEPTYAGILVASKRSKEHMQSAMALLPDTLHIVIKCADIHSTAEKLAENFDNVSAGVCNFTTIQDGIKVVFNFTTDTAPGAIYHFENGLNILRDDIPWLGLPDYLRSIAYNPPTKLYDARTELVARFLYSYTGGQSWMQVADEIEKMVPADIEPSFSQTLIDAVSITAKRLDLEKLW